MASAQRIVVGVDGTPAGRSALRWALDEAVRRGGGTVHAVASWRSDRVVGKAAAPMSEYHRLGAMLDAEIAAVPPADRAGVEITTIVLEGPAEDVLADQSGGADMLVLGNRRHSTAYHILFGWTSERCARKAGCPVVIVPAAGKPRRFRKTGDAATARTP
jgi:nucleotide-binding universal stress UspA family protein